MGRFKNSFRSLTRVPGVPEARHVTERAVAPYLRADLHSLHQDQILLTERLAGVELLCANTISMLAAVRQTIDAIERHQPAVLNAVASTNGTARILRRDFEVLHHSVAGMNELTRENSSAIAEMYTHIQRLGFDIAQGDENVMKEVVPHIESLAWLMRRVELIRAEMMNELRYGAAGGASAGGKEPVEVRVVNPSALEPADGQRHVNLGAGHIALDGFINVDMRELPGIDVIAPIDELPFAPASLAEIFSSHTLEHFPEEQLRRHLLPYFFGLLQPGGTIRAVVPDLEAMSKAFADGEVTFGVLRSVTYGGQEYEGDFHFTGFTPASLVQLFEGAGFVKARVIDRARQNGDCLECEVSATRPEA